MRWLSLSRLSVFAILAVGATLASADCSAKSYINCTGLCRSVLPCNDSYDECLSSCEAQQDKCERLGHPAAFLAYVACTSDAGFSCDDAGKAIANPPCGPQQAELIQCESDTDASLPIPDGAYEASAECVDAASCLSCCKDLWPSGAKEYSKAVNSCACGEGGKCESDCADAACAKPAQQPTNGDKCDLCLSEIINEQAADVGACVRPVTSECNQPGNVDCALYVNCVSQTGCTN
jgi:hypothetical protein